MAPQAVPDRSPAPPCPRPRADRVPPEGHPREVPPQAVLPEVLQVVAEAVMLA